MNFYYVRYDTKDDRHDYGKVDRMLGSGNKQVRTYVVIGGDCTTVDDLDCQIATISLQCTLQNCNYCTSRHENAITCVVFGK